MNLSLRQLKAFIGVAETFSFTKTAQRLHLSQAALSAVIRELESQLQCRLLDRNTRTVSLTEAGRCFLPTALHIVQMLESSALQLATMGREERRLLRVGVTPHIAVSLMPRVLKAFADLNPDVSVEVSDTAPGELLRLVETGELDAAYGAFFDKASGIDHTPIFPTHLLAVSPLSGGDNWLDPSSTQLAWSALQDVPLMALPKGNPIQRVTEEALSRERVTTGKRIVVGHMETAIAMAEAGFGVAILPSLSAAACERFRVRLHALTPRVEFAFYCITRSGRGNLELIERFSDVLKDIGGRFGRGARRRAAMRRSPSSGE